MSNNEKVTVTLSVYDWHKLLKELEWKLQFGNVDQTAAIYLYEKIATQLADHPVKVKQVE